MDGRPLGNSWSCCIAYQASCGDERKTHKTKVVSHHGFGTPNFYPDPEGPRGPTPPRPNFGVSAPLKRKFHKTKVVPRPWFGTKNFYTDPEGPQGPTQHLTCPSMTKKVRGGPEGGALPLHLSACGCNFNLFRH